MSLNPDKKKADPVDEYFKKKDEELKKSLRGKLSEEDSEVAREALREAHYMHCPKCGHALKEEDFQTIKIDRCTSCQGVWLDPGELNEIADEGSWFTGLIHSLKGK